MDNSSIESLTAGTGDNTLNTLDLQSIINQGQDFSITGTLQEDAAIIGQISANSSILHIEHSKENVRPPNENIYGPPVPPLSRPSGSTDYSTVTDSPDTSSLDLHGLSLRLKPTVSATPIRPEHTIPVVETNSTLKNLGPQQKLACNDKEFTGSPLCLNLQTQMQEMDRLLGQIRSVSKDKSRQLSDIERDLYSDLRKSRLLLSTKFQPTTGQKLPQLL